MADSATRARVELHFERIRQSLAARGWHRTAEGVERVYQATLVEPRLSDLLVKRMDRVITYDENIELDARISKEVYKMRWVEAAVPKEQESRLLDLPPELRNRIYEYALVASEGVEINRDTMPDNTALLQTCRQIRTEASGIFFAENVFHATVTNKKSPRHLIEWLKLHSTQVPRIQSLSITYRVSYNEKVLIKKAADAVKSGTPMSRATMGGFFMHAERVCGETFSCLAETNLPLGIVTAPSVELPGREEFEEYLLAHVARYWSSLVVGKVKELRGAEDGM